MNQEIRWQHPIKNKCHDTRESYFIGLLYYRNEAFTILYSLFTGLLYYGNETFTGYRVAIVTTVSTPTAGVSNAKCGSHW